MNKILSHLKMEELNGQYYFVKDLTRHFNKEFRSLLLEIKLLKT